MRRLYITNLRKAVTRWTFLLGRWKMHSKVGQVQRPVKCRAGSNTVRHHAIEVACCNLYSCVGQLQVVTNRRWHGKEKAYTSLDVFGYAQQTQVDLVKIDTEKSLVVMMGRSGAWHFSQLRSRTNEFVDNDGCLVVHCLRDPTQKALFRINQVRN
jgi:hypothetical protein